MCIYVLTDTRYPFILSKDKTKLGEKRTLKIYHHMGFDEFQKIAGPIKERYDSILKRLLRTIEEADMVDA